VNGNPVVPVSKKNAHSIYIEWTELQQAKLKIVMERYTLQGASGVWRVQIGQLGSVL